MKKVKNNSRGCVGGRGGGNTKWKVEVGAWKTFVQSTARRVKKRQRQDCGSSWKETIHEEVLPRSEEVTTAGLDEPAHPMESWKSKEVPAT